MPAVYSPSAKLPCLCILGAVACLALAAFEPRAAPVSLALAAWALRRAAVHSQSIELHPFGIVCRTRFTELRLPYRQVAAMRFSPVTGDLLLERPWVRVRIPRSFTRFDEIRRALSLAIWAHRGGDLSPDLTEPGSAFL